MNQAKDRSPLPLPDVINKDHINSSQKRDGLGSNNIVHIHVDPILCNSLAPSSLCKTHPNHTDGHSPKIDLDLAGATAADDSGLPESSLQVSSSLKNNVGCWDSFCDDCEDDRPGSFDYMPKHSGHVRITHSCDPPYDEEVQLDTSIGSSTIESPRSEKSGFRDENSVEAEKEDSLLSKETPLSYTKHKHTCWDYMPCGQHSEDEDMEDEEDERERRRASTSTSSFVPSFPRTPLRQVDECVSYNLKPLNGPDTGYSNQRITPMSYSVYQDRCRSEEGKEKDKKKSGSKDDSDKPDDVSSQVDVNGNPRLLDPVNYLQMRQWPRGKSENTASGSLSSYTPITISHSHGSSGSDPNAFDRKKERRRMKLERLKGTPAEEYKGHRKFSDIKDILAFVEGSKTSSKVEGKSAKKKQEHNRKKEPHHNGPRTLEDTAGGEDASGKEESVVVTPDVRPAPKAMGNSFRRSVGENSTSKAWLDEDDVDKLSNEFHDCLNSFPTEHATSVREQQHRLNDESGSSIAKIASSSTEADKSDTSSVGDSSVEKHLTDNNKVASKKSAKTKGKKEKPEICSTNGPLNAKSSMVKPKEILEIKDSVLSSCYENIKFRNSMDKESRPEVKREDSFTEVKKRKKRPGGKDSNAAPTCHSFSSFYHSHNNSGHPHHNNPRLRTGTTPLPPAMSSTVAASNSSSLPASNQIHSLRDLSPSAFPVLSGQSPPLTLHAEARRNSCGDLHSESVDNKTYDSDRESAKSLPAAHGARVGGDMSPIYPVSYARIAATLRKNDSTNSPNPESDAVSASQNSSISSNMTLSLGCNSVLPQPASNSAVTPERKATVWKGSPRERRHSIGSSPEDKAEGEKSSVTERNRQCGSQEVLSKNIITSVCDVPKDITASSSLQVKLTHTSDSSNSLPSHPALLKETSTPAANLISNQTKNTSALAVTKSLSQNAGKQLSATVLPSTEHATTNIISSSQAGPSNARLQPSISSQLSQVSVTAVPSGAQEKMDLIQNARKVKQETSTQSLSQSVTFPTADIKNVISRSKLNSGPDAVRKNSNTKSVIFLDKRFDSCLPQNLGITFGFDSSYESKYETTSQPASQQPQQLVPPHPQSASVVPPALSQSSSIDSSVQLSYQQQLPCPAVSQEHSHIPSAALAATASPKLTLSTSSECQSSSNSNSHMPKGPHIRGPRNGLILPSIPAGSGSVQQNQVASSSYNVSASNNNNNKDLTSSRRTSLSGVQPGNALSPNLHSVTNNDQLVMPGLPKSSAAAVANSSLAQVNTSVPYSVTGDTSVTITQASPAGGTSTSSSLPLQPPPTGTLEERDNTASSTLSLPSAQDKTESTPEYEWRESVLRESATNPPPSAKVGEAKDTLETPVTTITEAAAASLVAETASQQRQPPPPVPAELLPLAKPVVYGLKIKPGVGCGKVMFVPSNISKKNRGNSAEIGGFLRKRWLEDVIQKNGSGTFGILPED